MDAALPSNAKHVAVWSLRHRDVRREQRQIQIVAPVVRQRADDFGGKVRCFGRERGIDRRDLCDDGDPGELSRRSGEYEREIDLLAERDVDVRLGYRRISDGARRDPVIAKWQQSGDEHAAIAGFDGAGVIRLGVADCYERRNGIAARVSGDAANDAGSRLSL